MRSVTQRLEKQLPVIVQNVQTALPDLSTNRVIVYILPSFQHFNGQEKDIGDKTGVLLGVDGIVEYGGESSDIAVDISHELFHVYQHEMHPGVRDDQVSLWQAVWAEGSAAYASRVLTPGANEAAALEAELASADLSVTKNLACAIHSKWDSYNGNDLDSFLDAGKHLQNLPARGGYLIGYLVAQDLAKTYPLSEIGKLDGDELEVPMREKVNELCKSGALGAIK